MKIQFIRGVCLILFTLVFSLNSGSSLIWAEEDPYQGLPKGEGRELVFETCTACHKAALVLQNHMDRQHWDETITWMQEKQGLWELSPRDRETILNYLSTQQGLEGRRTQGMYEYDYPPNPLYD